ncbi:hypothetical protein DYBT9275_01212 [Dyadobacter sp. CECT 9275]|uniref:Transposase IS204/IS1001/IS1096/IS1165 DDE domain-containing protein n=1 Tax=Dyadobacter helix TaxID=2822344 RepID=A0A916NK99_9BACT|nr:hypothetical protein DYBT9275_01212 [Dyadobacter sp. CECT 9275]
MAIVAGTKAEAVIEVIRKIPESLRKKVTEITLDMASSMTMIAKRCFPRAVRVTDRFHVQRLAVEALQEIRIKHRWDALDKENDAIEQAKVSQTGYFGEVDHLIPWQIDHLINWRPVVENASRSDSKLVNKSYNYS